MVGRLLAGSRLLTWAHDRGTPLTRLQASEPTLAEIFHDIRQSTTAEEAATRRSGSNRDAMADCLEACDAACPALCSQL